MWCPHTWSLEIDGEKVRARSGVRNPSEGLGTGGNGESRAEKPYKRQRWNVNPVLSGPEVAGLCTVAGCLSKLQEPGMAGKVPTSRTVKWPDKYKHVPSLSPPPQRPPGLQKEARQEPTPPPSPWHRMIPRDIQPRDVSCLGCWPNKEIQDKPVILSWPHPAARQAETMAKRNSPAVFNGTFQEEMKLPSVAPLWGWTTCWGGEQGLPWRQSNGPPATPQRVKNSTASPQSLHTNRQEFLWGRVCLWYYRKRNQVCSWQFLQSPHSSLA